MEYDGSFFLKEIKQRQFRPQWENDYHLSAIGDLGLFYEYLEMVIQVKCPPLAPHVMKYNQYI